MLQSAAQQDYSKQECVSVTYRHYDLTRLRREFMHQDLLYILSYSEDIAVCVTVKHF